MIKRKKLYFAFACVVVFATCLISGFFFKPLFIIAIVALIGYLRIDKQHLRCPNCGGFENLDRLFYAKSHRYHCRHCGEIVRIEIN